MGMLLVTTSSVTASPDRLQTSHPLIGDAAAYTVLQTDSVYVGVSRWVVSVIAIVDMSTGD
jgi:hypothetical protein